MTIVKIRIGRRQYLVCFGFKGWGATRRFVIARDHKLRVINVYPFSLVAI